MKRVPCETTREVLFRHFFPVLLSAHAVCLSLLTSHTQATRLLSGAPSTRFLSFDPLLMLHEHLLYMLHEHLLYISEPPIHGE